MNEDRDKDSATAEPTNANSKSGGKSAPKGKLDIPTIIITKIITKIIANITLMNPTDGQNSNKKNKEKKKTMNGVAMKRSCKPKTISLPLEPSNVAYRVSFFQLSARLE